MSEAIGIGPCSAIMSLTARDVGRRDRRVVGDEAADRVGLLRRRGGTRRRQPGEQRFHQRPERDAMIDVVADPHLAIAGVDRAAQVDVLRRDAEVGVRQQHAEQEQGIGGFDEARDLGIARDAEIGAEQRRLGQGQEATAHEARDRGQREAPGELRDLILDVVAPGLDPDHQRRRLGIFEPQEDLLGAFGERVRVRRRGP
jgi:hypothetical protein